MKRKTKPSTLMKQWDKAVEKLKKEITAQCVKKGIKGRDKSKLMSRATSKLAKQLAAKAGMKSIGEVRCAADLELRGVPFSYETTTVEYQHKPQHYTPDFDIYNGTEKIHIEYKGKLDYETRKKLLAVKKCNPESQIFIVFEKASNKIRKGSKTTYGLWAENNSFPWSEGTVLEEWIK